MTAYDGDTVALRCVECDDVVGAARLSGDKRAIIEVEDPDGLSVGGWEYGALMQPLCAACHLRERLVAVAAEALSNDAGIDARQLADDWDLPESYVARAVEGNPDVVEVGVSPMSPFPSPEFDPEDHDINWDWV